MTKKLYYESAYIREWETRITRKLEREDGTYLIMEETAFYPHGGGRLVTWGGSIKFLFLMSFRRKAKSCIKSSICLRRKRLVAV